MRHKASIGPERTELQGEAAAIVLATTPQHLACIGLGQGPMLDQVLVGGVLREDQQMPPRPRRQHRSGGLADVRRCHSMPFCGGSGVAHPARERARWEAERGQRGPGRALNPAKRR